MTIDIHKALRKLPIIPKRGFTLPNMNYCGPYNPLNKQLIYDKNGNILKYIQQPTGNTDKICSQHDVDYALSKSLKDKHIADEKMINAINDLPYNQQQYGTFLDKSIIKSKRKLGLGSFTMEDLSNELNKPTIQKFERQKIIVNHINEIHSTDLVDMTQYSKMNKGYKYIFTNIGVFSKIAYAYPIESKKIQDIKPCFQKIFKNNKPKFIWSDKEPAFSSKEIQQFFKDNNVKIYHTTSHLKADVIERFSRSLRQLMMKEFVKNNNTVYYNILPKLIKVYNNNRYHSTIKMKPIEVNKNNEKYIKENIYTYNKASKIPKFKINDLVRISLITRKTFDKPSGNIKWTEELFKIYSINKSNVITYKIKDLNDNVIEGIFYERELQKTKNTSEIYIIEKIIKKNKNKYLVKWRNYSNDFNSWINKDNVVKHT